jgi:hypothetical protein
MFVNKTQRGRWQEVVALEPRLAELRKAVRAVKDDPAAPSFCANRHWYGDGETPGFRDRLSALVGWEREDPGPALLFTADAYDACYNTLYAALPNCRTCSCLSG